MPRFAALALVGLLAGAAPLAHTQLLADAATLQEHTTWYFYSVKWGHQGEFLDLFQKNHYPILKAQLGGAIKSIRTFEPKNHGDGRADWTFAVELTFTGRKGPSDEELAKKLYPDLETFRKEEQRRFQLLVAHWDVPLNELDLSTRRPWEK